MEEIGWLIAVLLALGIGFAFGRSATAARILWAVTETDTRVTFDDLGGFEAAKAELQEVVEFLQHPDQLGRLGARGPGGILLTGPEGSGRTLLARALAGEAGVPLISVRAGTGADGVDAAFGEAHDEGAAIILLDPLEAFCRDEATLARLLAAMDNFDRTAGRVILATAARPEPLDPALLRAGRFDMRLDLGLPDEPERARVLAVHARRLRLDPAADLAAMAALTDGFGRADLAALVDEAAWLATRRHGEAVTQGDLAAALPRLAGRRHTAPGQA